MNNKGSFLMRRIEYTPDRVNIYCDVRIKWLQEIYFYSIVKMPKVLFGLNEFENYEICDTYISIDLEEWSKFQIDIVSIFRNNSMLRIKVIENIKQYLNDSELFVDNVYQNLYAKGIMPNSDDVKQIFDCFINMDTFAVFNMFIPYEYYKNILINNGIDKLKYSVDDLMICSFYPHRLLVSQKKLELIKSYLNNEEVDVKNYNLLFGVYEEFENWIFDNTKLKETLLTFREIKNASKRYDLDSISYQLETYKNNRLKQMNKYCYLIDELKLKLKENGYNVVEIQNILDSVGFLSVIVSEEEKRHMIECKIFAVIAEILKKIQIDPARSELKRIINNYRSMEENDV